VNVAGTFPKRYIAARFGELPRGNGLSPILATGIVKAEMKAATALATRGKALTDGATNRHIGVPA
jgi:hypothetical protein